MLAVAGAVLGPLLVAAAIAAAVALGPRPMTLTAIVAAIGLDLAVTARAVRGRRVAGLAALASHALLTGFLWSFRSAPIDREPAFAGTWPSANPPASMAIFRLPTAVIHRSAAFAYRGGSVLEARPFAMNALLVRHPRGDVLIDAGLGRDIEERLRAFPLPFRAVTDIERAQSVAEQLAERGYDPAQLRGVIATHAHWDHLAGIVELPGVPVLVPAEERRFIDTGGAVMGLTRGLGEVRYEPYAFEPREHLGFPASHDLYGDGSLVIVPAPGHTPGSVAVFLTLPPGRGMSSSETRCGSARGSRGGRSAHGSCAASRITMPGWCGARSRTWRRSPTPSRIWSSCPPTTGAPGRASRGCDRGARRLHTDASSAISSSGTPGLPQHGLGVRAELRGGRVPASAWPDICSGGATVRNGPAVGCSTVGKLPNASACGS